jgi:rubrerythrin
MSAPHNFSSLSVLGQMLPGSDAADAETKNEVANLLRAASNNETRVSQRVFENLSTRLRDATLDRDGRLVSVTSDQEVAMRALLVIEERIEAHRTEHPDRHL